MTRKNMESEKTEEKKGCGCNSPGNDSATKADIHVSSIRRDPEDQNRVSLQFLKKEHPVNTGVFRAGRMTDVILTTQGVTRWQ